MENWKKNVGIHFEVKKPDNNNDSHNDDNNNDNW